MDYKSSQFLRFASAVIFILSILEIISIFTFLFTSFNLRLQNIIFIELLLSNSFPLKTKLVFLFFSVFIILALILSIIFYRFSFENMDELKYSKYLLMIGVFIFVFSYIKLEYIVLMGDSSISILTYIVRFEVALLTPSISPFYIAVIWNFFVIVICTYLTLAMILSGWALVDIIEKTKKKRN